MQSAVQVCYNYGELDAIEPVGEGIWVIGGTKFYENDIDLLLEIHKNLQGLPMYI